MDAEQLARWEGAARPYLARVLPGPVVTRLYSAGREAFLDRYVEESVEKPYTPPQEYHRELWGIAFQSPLMNAAGMFKDGRGYEVVAAEGAGAYLAGTVTPSPRDGNEKGGIGRPFTPLPASDAAVNWLGLPNDGYTTVAERLAGIERQEGCPVGVSLAGDPERPADESQTSLLEGLHLFADVDTVDFLEINESCPNTGEERLLESGLADRLAYLEDGFLEARRDTPPVVVKFSNDTETEQVPELVNLLLEHGYDGVNFGNTSTAYDTHQDAVAEEEHRLYDYFTDTFGGGVSGEPLRERSLELSRRAVNRVETVDVSQDFNVVRTGGIREPGHVRNSEEAGVSLNQWYTGMFDAFASDGHDLYREFFGDSTRQRI